MTRLSRLSTTQMIWRVVFVITPTPLIHSPISVYSHKWGVNRCQVKGCHHNIPFWNICNSRVAFISFCALAEYKVATHSYPPVSCVETFFMFKEKTFLRSGSPYCILVFALFSTMSRTIMILQIIVRMLSQENLGKLLPVTPLPVACDQRFRPTAVRGR